MIDLELEELSDKVRHGTPIDFADALSVIAYQRRKKTIYDKLWFYFYYYWDADIKFLRKERKE